MSAPWLWEASANWCEQKLMFLTFYEQQTKGFAMAHQSGTELSVMNFIPLESVFSLGIWGGNGRLRSLEWNLYICPLLQMAVFSGKEGLPKDIGSSGVPASLRTNHFIFMELVPIFNRSPWYTPMINDFLLYFCCAWAEHPFLLDLFRWYFDSEQYIWVCGVFTTSLVASRVRFTRY